MIKKHVKIKFNLDEDLPQNKSKRIPKTTQTK